MARYFSGLECFKVTLNSPYGSLKIGCAILDGVVPMDFNKLDFPSFSLPLSAVTNLKLGCGKVALTHGEFASVLLSPLA